MPLDTRQIQELATSLKAKFYKEPTPSHQVTPPTTMVTVLPPQQNGQIYQGHGDQGKTHDFWHEYLWKVMYVEVVSLIITQSSVMIYQVEHKSSLNVIFEIVNKCYLYK